ncbi:GntR family transcriptional regulator [Sporolactobacillus sp. CQH2019]|uniref:GntR family transcriptional regulator n=1 Tax=Sporolactobacillus sp. CQH2019 TaxID=3023512 RepID=UPI0023688269|nr:GntR family transcriptional regulator [Sporolactobacillus sp. CQH2019]MDD9148900.1 GntR family transcriptional regulator [Sporolactobacillus sp. CQH2019]
MKGNSYIPLYIQIENDLKFKINSGEWKPGDKIPPELELTKLYNVSRITIRNAIKDLVQDNYLHRERARGTFVLGPEKITEKTTFSLVKSFTQEMRELGKTPITFDVKVKKIEADAFLAERLHLNIGNPVLYLERLRGADNEVLTYSITHIPFREGYSLDEKNYFGSLYDYLTMFNIHINQQHEYVEAIKANRQLQSLLRVEADEPILKRVRQTSQVEQNYYEYSENYYIGSKYRFYVEY